MPLPVIVVEPGPIASSRKLLASLLTIGVTFMIAVNGPDSDVGAALITVIPLIVGAVVLYFTENTPDSPSSKFLVTLGAAIVTLAVFLVQHGVDDWRAAGLTFAIALIGALATWLTPNANQQFIDAVPAPPAR